MVKRYNLRPMIDGDNVMDWPRDLRHGPNVVLAPDYDALAARLAEATAAWHDRDTRLLAMEARLAEARANAFQDALDCMRDRQARDHLAACLQDKYGVWWKTDSATHRESERE